MQMQVHFLFPFDMGLELDFKGKDAQEIFKELSTRKMTSLFFEGISFSGAEVTTQIYKFGVGLIQISFHLEGDLTLAARLSCYAENLVVGKSPIVRYCQGLVDGVIKQASQFANYRYEKRLEEADIFPVFVLGEGAGELPKRAIHDAAQFIRKHRKALYGIVAGEPRYEKLSEFVLERGQLKNLGYYENEMILIERFGGVVASTEHKTILNLIKLSYSQYWSLKAYNFILDRELDDAQRVLEHLPPYYKFWLIPNKYQAFSVEAMDFNRDKLAIVESLYTVSSNIPKIDSDWHLRTVHASVRKVFNIEDLYKTVDNKLSRIEESYNNAREFLSTNFFILLDFIFFASLAWSIVDTILLFRIAHP